MTARFEGVAVLLVEDEIIISFMVEDMVKEFGCSPVWHAADVNDAITRIDSHPPDVALLDVNLGKETAFPVAERLDQMRIPFVFATGYGREGIPERWAARPVIQKPFRAATLADALAAALSRRRASAARAPDRQRPRHPHR